MKKKNKIIIVSIIVFLLILFSVYLYKQYQKKTYIYDVYKANIAEQIDKAPVNNATLALMLQSIEPEALSLGVPKEWFDNTVTPIYDGNGIFSFHYSEYDFIKLKVKNNELVEWFSTYGGNVTSDKFYSVDE